MKKLLHLFDSIKQNPLQAILFLAPILFFYILPLLFTLSSVVTFVLLGLYSAYTGFYLYTLLTKEDKEIQKSILALLFYTVFGVGRSMMLLVNVEAFDFITPLFFYNLLIVLVINVYITVTELLKYHDVKTRTDHTDLPLIFGLSMFNLLFLLAKPITLANPDTFSSDINILMIVIVLVVINYIVNVIGKTILKGNLELTESKKFVDVSGSIIAIIIGLLFGLIIMLIFNPDQAFQGFFIIIRGAFYDGYTSIGDTVFYAVPIILTGLSVAFAFRTGLFNIGATGQLTMGAYFAVYVGVKWGFLGDIHPLLHWGTAVLVAALAGGIWGLIPGILKAYRNVNEVVTTIMLNYIGMYMVTMMIKNNIFNQTAARTLAIKETAANPGFNLDFLIPGSRLNGTIVVGVVVVLIIHIILNKTTFGYELKAVGFNRDAAKYAGMNEKRNIAISMAIAGAVAGIAGAMLYLSPGTFMKPENTLLGEGFTGIAIALLGLSSPFGVLLAGLFFSSLERGGFYMQLLEFKPEIIDIILAVIIYASALGLFLQKFVKILFGRKKEPKTPQSVVTEGGDE